MSQRHLLLGLLAASLLAGCAGRLETTVRKRAVSDLDCPDDQVTVERDSVGAMSGRYNAQGCDREETYVGRCNMFGMCVAQRPGEIPEPTPSAPASVQADNAPPRDAGASTSFSQPEPAKPAAPAAPTVVSITLRNACPNTVKIFFGDKPKFGSGTYSSMSSNSSTSKSMRPGDMIWIVDDSQNGVSSATVSASTRKVEITSSCTGLTAR